MSGHVHPLLRPIYPRGKESLYPCVSGQCGAETKFWPYREWNPDLSSLTVHSVVTKLNELSSLCYAKIRQKRNMFLFLWLCVLTSAMVSSFLRLLDHTHRSTTDSRTSLDKWLARRRDLYLTTHNTPKRQIFMLPEEFEPANTASDRPQTHAVGRVAAGTCRNIFTPL